MNSLKRIGFALIWICCLVEGMAQVHTTPEGYKIDRIKKEIKDAIDKKRYAYAGLMYDTLAGMYDNLYGFNKYTLNAYFQARKQFGIVRDSQEYFRYTVLIANYYLKDDYFNEQGFVLHQQALHFYQRKKDEEGITLSMIGLAYHYVRQGKNKLTEKHLFNTLNAAKKNGNPEHIANSYSIIANYFMAIKEMKQAIKYADTSWELSNKYNISWLKSLSLFYRGLYEEYEGDPQQAISLFQKAILFADSTLQLSLKRDLLKHLAQVYDTTRQHHQAYLATIDRINIVNQLHESERTKNIRLVEINERINNLVEERNRVRQTQLHKQKALNRAILGLTLLGVFILLLLFWIYMQQKLNTQRALLQQKHQEQKMLEALIKGQDQERHRLALELHDGLGSLLARSKLFVSFNSHAIDNQMTNVHDILNTLEHQLNEACEAVSEISDGLEPFALRRFGLQASLIDLVHRMQSATTATIQLHHCLNELLLDTNMQFMIFRIVQELLSNAIKHANATLIVVQLIEKHDDRELMIQIEDNGMGFNLQNTALGNGLDNIKFRVAFLKGTAEWISGKEGTLAQILIPL